MVFNATWAWVEEAARSTRRWDFGGYGCVRTYVEISGTLTAGRMGGEDLDSLPRARCSAPS